MAPEYVVGFVMLASIVVLGAGFIFSAFAARQGPDDYEPIHRNGYRVRRYWFVGLMCLALAAFGFTLPRMANPLFQKTANPIVVNVTGEQWEWVLSSNSFPQDKTIEFKVTSKDVNHDFAIFNSDGNLVGQVQAMPGYTNDLYLTFKKPGTYTIRCLELCGLYHTSMLSSFTVKGPGA